MRAPADEHCAINVCLYGPQAKRWTMTERAARHVRRTRDEFVVGPSRCRWTGSGLEIELCERGVPLPQAVRGTIRVVPDALTRFVAALDAPGRHLWAPIAPSARVEVELDAPRWRWSGQGYIDSNEGQEPVGAAFTRWDWLRTERAGDGSSIVVYDIDTLDGERHVIAERFAADGTSAPFELPRTRHALRDTRWWRIARRVCAPDPDVRLVRTLEDTPFYARSLLEWPLPGGGYAQAVHETLDVRRLEMPVVQAMMPFRMPRRR